MGDAPADIAFGDFNEDGEVDQAVASGGASSVAILLGDGSGGFTATTASPVTMHGTAAGSVAVGDLNEDGHLDLVATNNGPWGIGRLLGDGSGNFTYNATALAAGDGWETADTALVETDHDGNLDIVTAIPSEDFIDQMFGNGAGSLSSSTVIGTGVGSGPTSLAFGNFNNDGDPDAVVLKSLSGDLEILRGFAGCCFLTSSEAAPSPGAPAVGDFDEDGDDDIAVADTTAGEMTLLLSDGGSNVDFDVAPASGFEIGPSAGPPAVADLNSDGDLDLAVANPATDQVAVFLGDGDGGFTDSPRGPYDVGEDPAFVAAADLDGDARTDLAVANEGSDDVTVLLAGRNDLSVVTIGDGSGYLDSSPAGIDCASDSSAHADCRQEYADDQVVDITAHPGPDSDFHGFPGSGCSGSGPTCTVTMDQARTVTGDFRLKVYDLETSTTGSGVGEIHVSPAGDDCGPSPPGATCDTYEFGTSVTLTADPLEESSNFTGWGGDCASFGSAETCTVTIDDPKSVTAEYTLKQRRIDVTTSGTGSGVVLSTPAGIDCGSGGHTDCDETSYHGDQITLSAQEDFATSEFKGWSDPSCPDEVQSCVVTYDAAKTIDAQFDLKPRALTVTTSGTGSGYVTGSLGDLDCGQNAPGHSDCTDSRPHGTEVTLTVHPDDPTSSFTGWSGDGCSGTSQTCTVTLDQARTIGAEFTLRQRALTVNPTGTGSGYVDSSLGDLDCGQNAPGHSDCTDSRPHGTEVTLTAHPDGATTDFGGWSGDGCSGAALTCTVTLDQARTIGAAFPLTPRALTLNATGSGSGYVDSAPPGIDCGVGLDIHADCDESYGHGTDVTLSLHADAGTDASFAGGGCRNAGSSCTVDMDRARTVRARFAAELGTDFTRALSDPLSAGALPRDLALADLDGDGHLDQASVDEISGQVTIGLGEGDGAFAPADTSPETLPDGAMRLVVGNFDGTGGPDLAVANRDTPSVRTLLNQGGGDFAVGPAPLTVPSGVNGLAAGDLDGDGDDDLIATSFQGRMHVLTSDGAGGFSTSGSGTPLSAQAPAAVVADLDGDGDRDVALVRAPAGDDVRIYENNGSGGLTLGDSVPVGDNPADLVAGDFDDDGTNDLAAASPVAGSVSILLSDGDADLAHAPGSPVSRGWAPTALGTGDFDEDDKLDLVVADDQAGGQAAILLGDGGGAFTSPASSPEPLPSPNLSSIAAGDLNEDGREDFAFTTSGLVFSMLGNAQVLTTTTSGTGPGRGRVDSQPEGIDCPRNISGPSDCSQEYPPGTEVTLTARPQLGTDFAGWSGACSGSALTCTVTMDQARTVDASFAIQRKELTVVADGTQPGAVFATGITCGHDMPDDIPGMDFTDCAESFDYGTAVFLSAGGDPDTTKAELTGGGCTGGDTCTVTMEQARHVTATFTLIPRTLEVIRTGSGAGTVTGPGIDCGPGAGHDDCTETVLHGGEIALTASPDAATSDFGGYEGGGCGAAGSCTVAMNADKAVDARFSLKSRTLTVSTDGTGGGSVSGNGIDCGTGTSGDCTAVVPHGGSVELTATADGSSDLAGVSGDCSASPCTVTMNSDRSVGVTFAAKPRLPAADTTAPETTIRKLKRNSKKRKATITFESSEVGSTFECSLGGKKPKPCESPVTYKKLDPGKTAFEVAAIDAAGNADPTPAKTKIKLPSRKRSP